MTAPREPRDEDPSGPRAYRFGVFDVDVRSGELRKRGLRQKLQGKPLQVLLALLERPGETVTRDELQRRLWPADVFVDFESGLNTAANRLRLALGDSAEHPRYIETLARHGYRFIAPVEAIYDTSARHDREHERDGEPERASPLGSAAPSPRHPNERVSGGLGWRPLLPRTAQSAVAVTLLTGAVFIGTVMAVRKPAPSDVAFRPITFRRGQVGGARFAPDGRSVLYSANWDNGPRQLFLTSPLSPESRSLGFENLGLVSISRSGELALIAADGTMPVAGGSLSRVPMNGGSPRPAEQHVMSADWTTDGDLVIARAVDGTNRLEWPAGRVVHTTSGWISSIRVSPRGDRVAFLEHPVRHDNRGRLMLAEADAARQTAAVRALTTEWAIAGGLSWHPTGDEILVTATRDATPRSLWTVSLTGEIRSVARIAGAMTVRDVAHDGTVLVTRDTEQLEMAMLDPASGQVRDLSWLDWSRVADVSRDGRVILFDETGTGGGPESLVYLRRLDDDSTVRLGEGLGLALSPDGRSALTVDAVDRTRLRRVPLDGGPAVDVAANGLAYQWVQYFPDGRRMLVQATEPGRPLRLYVVDEARRAVPLTPPDTVRNAAIDPDGRRVAVLGSNGVLRLYSVDGVSPPAVVQSEERLAPLLWPERDRVLVQRIGQYTQIPTSLAWLDLTTGRTETWHDLRPRDTAGVNAITKVMVSANSRSVVFNYRRVLSELFVTNTPPRELIR